MQTVLVAAVVTCGACYPALHLLLRTGGLDVPNARSSHAAPTPRGGGLALLVGIAAAGMASLAAGPPWSTASLMAVTGSTALALIGLTDDRVGLSPRPRLLAQAAIGVATGAALAGWPGALVGAVVIPAAVNMVNFMDGINGICAGHAVVWGAGALAASSFTDGDVLAVLGALSLGCGLGFLPWNVPRARLFLGDVGSYLLGGIAGIGVLVAITSVVPGRSTSDPWLLLGLVCAPYLLFAADTATTLVRRLASGQSLVTAHRSHVYQRLVNERSLPHWVVSATIGGLSALVTWAVTEGAIVGLVTAVLVTAGYLSSPRLASRMVPL